MIRIAIVRQLIDDELTDLYLLRATYKGQHRVSLWIAKIDAKIDCLTELLKKIN